MAFTAADGAEQAEAVSELILATLKGIVEAGFAADALEANPNPTLTLTLTLTLT